MKRKMHPFAEIHRFCGDLENLPPPGKNCVTSLQKLNIFALFVGRRQRALQRSRKFESGSYFEVQQGKGRGEIHNSTIVSTISIPLFSPFQEWPLHHFISELLRYFGRSISQYNGGESMHLVFLSSSGVSGVRWLCRIIIDILEAASRIQLL